MKKKILVLTTTFPRWKNDSTPPFVFELERRLASDFDLTVLAPHYPQAKFKETMGNLKIYRFPYFFPPGLQKLCYEGGILAHIKTSLLAKIQVPFLLFFELFFAWELIKKEKFKLVHAHWTVPSGFIALILKRIFSIPVLVTAHAGDVFTENVFIKAANKLVVKYANFITVNSQATKRALGISDNNLPTPSIIPMGVDLSRFRPIDKEKIVKIRDNLGLQNKKIILFVGRLEEKKGVSFLIEAMPKILDKLADVHLVIIGYGSEEERLKNLVKKLNLQGKVSFLGKISNEELPLYYNLSDVFVAPSIKARTGDTEGLGVVFLEAIASGIAVIGTNVGGIPDIIRNNETGLLVEQKNSEELAKAIIKVLQNPKLRKKLAKAALTHVKESFLWENITQNFSKIYKNLLEEKKDIKRILVTSTTFPTFSKKDSTPPFVYRLSRMLAQKKNLKIIVSTPYKEGAKIYEEIYGMKIHRYKYGFISLCDGPILPNIAKNKLLYFQVPSFLIAAFFNLRMLIKKEKIDVVHAHWIFPQAFLAVIYKKIFKKNLKIICTVHGADVFGLKFPFSENLLRLTLRGCDFTTVNSRATKKAVLKILKTKNIKIIPMGVNLNRFQQKMGNDKNSKMREKYDLRGPFLLFVGMLRKEKGIEYLIRAMCKVLKKFPSCKLLIAGRGGDESTLKALTEKLRLKKNIIFSGGIPNAELPKFYSAADITILPSSEYEGLGTVLLESLAMGTAVIGTNLGGIPDIIKNGKTGLLVKTKDSQALAKGIERLLGNKLLRERLARVGQEYVRKNFSWKIIGNEFRNLIESY